MRTLAPTVLACSVLALGLGACGGDDSTTEASSTPTSTNASGPPVENTGGAAPSTVDLAADPSGALAYDTTELTAAAGQPKIVFTNDSGTPHDVTIEDANGNTIGQSDTITEGKTEVSFSAESDTYTFYCSVDSHREAGMEGTLTLVNP
jgi:plastocyanin